MRQYIHWENLPNTKDEKPSNSSSMIERFGENGLQQINILHDKREQPRNREDICSYNCNELAKYPTL